MYASFVLKDLTDGSGIGLHEKLRWQAAVVNVSDEEELELDMPDLPDQ